MKKLTLTIGILTSLVTQAQVEPIFETIDANQISTIMSSSGTFFWDFQNSQHFVPKEDSIGTIFSHGIWIGGLDDNYNLKLTAETYRQSGTDYWHGPVADEYTAEYDEKYNKVWKLSKEMIVNHINHFDELGYTTPEAIETWPAHGNTTNGESENLAPFIDQNNNGTYEPHLGDYPDVKGDQTLYSIFNDHTVEDVPSMTYDHVGVEIHAMFYAYQCDDNLVSSLNQTLFLNLDFYNRSESNYHDFYIGSFTDFDIGHYNDDFIGCDSTLNLYYAYNGDNNDDSGNQWSYGENPPVSGVKILNKNMNSFITNYNLSGEVYSSERYYYYLSGRWDNGNPITIGGNGYSDSIPTNYLYHSSPNNPTGWSEYTAGLTPSDRRGIGSTGPYNFNVGDKIEVDYAFLYSRGDGLNHIQNVDLLYEHAQAIQDFYDGTLTNTCWEVGIDEIDNLDYSIYPNPASDLLSFESEQMGDFIVYDVAGKQVMNFTKTEKIQTIDIRNLSTGIYTIDKGKHSISFVKK